ncbi:AfsR/SARP family transcriptional regulator [Streptomyces griseorubiginosus]|uniref:AfsR/SARP family transcriptional regulator n=1 Tax=Streptomyces griseorubiginosus TaxID=67304 RepID=UPI0036EB0F77
MALATKPRTLLALFLLHQNCMVERDWLIDQLWAGKPPEAAKSTLRAYVYQLRKQFNRLGCSDVMLRGQSGGYALDVANAAVDNRRFEELSAQGRQALQQGRFEGAASAFREGLALWRGAAFSGIEVPALREKAILLDELRLEVTELCLGAELELGAPTVSVAELEALTSMHPLREGLWRLLMLGLYRSGRQGESLEVYQRLYRLLDDELGIKPSAQIEQLHHQILNADPELLVPSGDPSLSSVVAPRLAALPNRAVPRQLPASMAYFTGRKSQLIELKELLSTYDDTGDRPGEVLIAVITGMKGIGKTALAVHWAHRIAKKFPDGQLYANLRGCCPEERDSPICTFLESLGVPPEEIPTSMDARVGLYRSLLADKRFLVVLDNARDANQVRSLLPGTSGSLVIITSRNQLLSLIAQGAHPITLAQLDAEDSIRFLRRRLGEQRTAAEPMAVARIIDKCAGYPLDLALVAARATSHSELPLESLAAEPCQANSCVESDYRPCPSIDGSTATSQ